MLLLATWAVKTVRVYNKEGMVYDLQAEGSPVQFALNETGYLSLITKNDSSYRICVYNRKGKLLKERVEESKGHLSPFLGCIG